MRVITLVEVVQQLVEGEKRMYIVQPTSTSEVNEQRATYTALLQNLGQATFEEIEADFMGIVG